MLVFLEKYYEFNNLLTVRRIFAQVHPLWPVTVGPGLLPAPSWSSSGSSGRSNMGLACHRWSRVVTRSIMVLFWVLWKVQHGQWQAAFRGNVMQNNARHDGAACLCWRIADIICNK